MIDNEEYKALVHTARSHANVIRVTYAEILRQRKLITGKPYVEMADNVLPSVVSLKDKLVDRPDALGQTLLYTDEECPSIATYEEMIQRTTRLANLSLLIRDANIHLRNLYQMQNRERMVVRLIMYWTSAVLTALTLTIFAR